MIPEILTGYEQRTPMAEDLSTNPTMMLPSECIERLGTIKAFSCAFIFHPVLSGQEAIGSDFILCRLGILVIIIECKEEAFGEGSSHGGGD